MIRAVVFAMAIVLFGRSAVAGEYNAKLSVGDAAPAWTGLPGVDGKEHSLADLKDKEVIVVVFTCNHCPVAIDYQDRVIEFSKKHASAESKVALVAINVSTLEADKLPKMKERASKKGFNFPYVYDASQKMGRLYGASVTPEFFIIDKDRKIAYMGAMDDNWQPEKVKVHHLEDAVAALLKGEKPAKAETRARGCVLKYEKVASK